MMKKQDNKKVEMWCHTKFFSSEDLCLSRLIDKGNPLKRLNRVINWESFRSTLNRIFPEDQTMADRGGRPYYDYVMMFKLLILQRYNNLSDNDVKYRLLERLSFRRFL